jgi:hypothetical protein
MTAERSGTKPAETFLRASTLIVAAFSLLALFAAGHGAASGQTIYRWRDAEGKLHFGQAPPSQVQPSAASGRALSPEEGECARREEQECIRIITKGTAEAIQQCIRRGRRECREQHANPTRVPIVNR